MENILRQAVVVSQENAMSASQVIPNELPLIEPVMTADIFCSELARIEKIGPCARLIFSVQQYGIYGENPAAERAVVARLVLPIQALTTLARQLSTPINECAATGESATAMN
jgi:hypothetical protein